VLNKLINCAAHSVSPFRKVLSTLSGSPSSVEEEEEEGEGRALPRDSLLGNGRVFSRAARCQLAGSMKPECWTAMIYSACLCLLSERSTPGRRIGMHCLHLPVNAAGRKSLPRDPFFRISTSESFGKPHDASLACSA
jgi:hypothetical protein